MGFSPLFDLTSLTSRCCFTLYTGKSPDVSTSFSDLGFEAIMYECERKSCDSLIKKFLFHLIKCETILYSFLFI